MARPPHRILCLGVTVDEVSRAKQARVRDHGLVQLGEVAGGEGGVAVAFITVRYIAVCHRHSEPNALAAGVDAIGPSQQRRRIFELDVVGDMRCACRSCEVHGLTV